MQEYNLILTGPKTVALARRLFVPSFLLLTAHFAAAWQQSNVDLISPATSTSQGFGKSVALEDDWMAVYDHAPSLLDARSTVTLYERTTGGWVLRQVLRAANPGTMFGSQLDLSDERLIIGEYSWPVWTQPPIGRAYIYGNQGGNWVQEAVLEAPAHAALPPPNNGGYANAVAVYGDWAFVAALFQAVSGPGTRGAVHAYKRTGGGWVYQQEILPPTLPETGFSWRLPTFGASIAVSGDTLVVGCPAGDLGGRVFTYDFVGGVWVYRQMLAVPPGYLGFGRSVAIDASTLVVGHWSHVVIHAGRAHLFERDASGLWVYAELLRAQPTGIPSQISPGFGEEVRIDGKHIVVAAQIAPAYIASLGGYANYGAVYLFTRDALTGWPQYETIKLTMPWVPPQYTNLGLGRSLDFSNGTVVAGNYLVGQNPSSYGGVAVFVAEEGRGFCSPPHANSTGNVGQLRLNGALNAFAPDLHLTAYDVPEQVAVRFFVSLRERSAPLLYGQGSLCLGIPMSPLGSVSVSSAAGVAYSELPLVSAWAGLALAGENVFVQAFYLDAVAGAWNSTNGVEFYLE